MTVRCSRERHKLGLSKRSVCATLAATALLFLCIRRPSTDPEELKAREDAVVLQHLILERKENELKEVESRLGALHDTLDHHSPALSKTMHHKAPRSALPPGAVRACSRADDEVMRYWADAQHHSSPRATCVHSPLENTLPTSCSLCNGPVPDVVRRATLADATEEGH